MCSSGAPTKISGTVTFNSVQNVTLDGLQFAGGKVWFTYGGKRFGYIHESYWPGGFSAVTETQTYAEVYNNSPGGSQIPTMNGSVSHYRTSTGSHLGRYGVSSPYRITHATGTGFTFSG